jgi:hypothetical protein
VKEPTPEDRDRMRRTAAQAEAARRNMQEILDRVAERRREREARASRRRALARRLLRFGRAA